MAGLKLSIFVHRIFMMEGLRIVARVGFFRFVGVPFFFAQKKTQGFSWPALGLSFENEVVSSEKNLQLQVVKLLEVWEFLRSYTLQLYRLSKEV